MISVLTSPSSSVVWASVSPPLTIPVRHPQLPVVSLSAERALSPVLLRCFNRKREPIFDICPSLRYQGFPSRSGACRASQAVDLFPSFHPEVVVRDIRLEDCWEVAETHCSSFFSGYRFPWDLLLRLNRFVGLLSGFSAPSGCLRTCLVAITECDFDVDPNVGIDSTNAGSIDAIYGFNRGIVAGILTLDAQGDFLPRRGPQRQRRTEIAYISNVAVRKTHRRKGVAKRLISASEARARSWGCRAIALHCDVNDFAATCLYKGQGFKSVKVPEGAKWPRPKAPPGTQFDFMMKLLTFNPSKTGSCLDHSSRP